MSNVSPGNRVEISDLLEATFWEANKFRIALVVGVIVVGILGWVGWSSRIAATEAASWSAVVDEQFQPRPNIELSDSLKKSAAGPWALYLAARNAFEQNKLDDAERILNELKGGSGYAQVNRDQRVDRLLEDVKSEINFKKANPGTKASTTYPDGRILTLKSDAGDIKIGLASDTFPTLASRFLKLCRNSALAKNGFAQATPSDSLEATIEPENAADCDPANISWTAAESQLVRTGKALAHGKGAVTMEFTPAKKAEEGAVKPENAADSKGSIRLTIQLGERPARGTRSIVVGYVQSSLETLIEVSKRKQTDAGKIDPPLTVTATEEGADLKAIP